MRYTIRHFDLPLLTFEANMDSADTGLHFIKVYEENRSFLPLYQKMAWNAGCGIAQFRRTERM